MLNKEKEYYRLYRDYLKRSELYGILCDLFRNTPKGLHRKFMALDMGDFSEDATRRKKLLGQYIIFGDVWSVDFEKWWIGYRKKEPRYAALLRDDCYMEAGLSSLYFALNAEMSNFPGEYGGRNTPFFFVNKIR